MQGDISLCIPDRCVSRSAASLSEKYLFLLWMKPTSQSPDVEEIHTEHSQKPHASQTQPFICFLLMVGVVVVSEGTFPHYIFVKAES